ncbi:Hypothetical predicted protein [Mytilus galloprovincialis]|uniref:Helitron helicase-like domain-containing protein n=1 Tax=Mytilus galloprovincialis TaxID=29158 RepID=A0A8B6BXI4_MYTGA|nr:Hypothetical predicted protein [Mytilus galloprovincialis]
MQIRQLPRGGQLSVKGNVVNVPVEVQPTINSLPHTLEKSGTISVKLKKKLEFKNEVDENETHVGNTDTLLDHIPDDNPLCDAGLTFAPGEGQRPISLYSDPDAEYLSFPTIFCGQRRPDNKDRSLRNSPVYLEKRKKDLFAMIRQLGLPTWFGSLSSADTNWKDLLRILGKLNDGKEYTDNELEEMDWNQKSKLVQKDPVTCSRYFDYRVQQFY